jgi:hypothetical protein
MLGWNAFDQHVRLGRDNGWVDESKEKETANEGANGIISRFRVLALLELFNQ